MRAIPLVLGHADLNTTQRYLNVTDEELRRTMHEKLWSQPLTSNLVLQLRRDLFQFVPGGGGRWKSTANDITETRPD